MTQPQPVDTLTLFVNRTGELAELSALLTDLERGERRHVALLGLRRIGKTVLLDEFRRRHLRSAISYVALDEIVSTPEDFARAFLAETLRAAARGAGHAIPQRQDNGTLRQGAQLVGPAALEAADEVIETLASHQPGESYGALLAMVMRFPATISVETGRPLIVMLDEFQEIVRLRAFPGTGNLLGTLRAALDQRGKVAFVVAGSRVTALRALLGDSEMPLFMRFEQIELKPFAPDATHELTTRIWDDDDLACDPDASTRLHKLTGGWPFYVQVVAARARQLARMGGGGVTDEIVDLAFRHELVGRAAAMGQYCRYLLDTALRTDTNGLRNTLEAVLRQVARWQSLSRSSLERRLRRHHGHTAIHTAVNRLIDADFLREEAGLLTMQDPVFSLWLNLEEVRRDPDALVNNPPVLQRTLAWYEAQHQQDRQAMGLLFERRVENVARQFHSQDVDGVLFGMDLPIQLPVVRHVAKIRVDDPTGAYGGGPDTYEVDLATTGDGPHDCWAIEAKHRRGAITLAMVERFLRSAHAVERAHGMRFARCWIVASRGVRGDALTRLRETGTLASGLRQLERLERLLADPFDFAAAGLTAPLTPPSGDVSDDNP